MKVVFIVPFQEKTSVNPEGKEGEIQIENPLNIFFVESYVQYHPE